MLRAEVSSEKRADPAKQIALLQTFESNVSLLPLPFQQKYFNKLALLYQDLAKYKEALAVTEKGLALVYDGAKNSRIYCQLLYVRGFSYESLDNYGLAEDSYQKGLKQARKIEDGDMTARGLINLGALAYLSNRFDDSLSLLNEALMHAEKINNAETLGMVHSELSLLHSYLQQPKSTIEYAEKSLHYFLQTDSKSSILNQMSNLASSYGDMDQPEKAISQFEELVTISKEFGNYQYQFYAYFGISREYRKKEDYQTAFEYITKVDELVPHLQHGRHVINYYVIKGELLAKLKRYDEALKELAIAEGKMGAFNESIANFYDIYLNDIKADVYMAKQQYEKALEYKKTYIDNYVSYRNLLWQQNTEELRIKLISDKIALKKAVLLKQQALNKAQLNLANVSQKKRQIQIFIATTLILLACYLLFMQVKAQRKFKFFSQTDELTGLLNRSRLFQVGEELLSDASLKKQPIAILALDIDHFKNINDSYGHKVGDEVIKGFANVCSDVLRKEDVFARIGGEEFIAILVNTNKTKSKEVAQRCINRVAEHMFEVKDKAIKATCSIGIYNIEESLDDKDLAFELLIKHADAALYQAKENGRNQAVLF